MGNKLMTAGCFLGALTGALSLWSAPATDVQRIFRLSVALLAVSLIVVGAVMMARGRSSS